MASGSSPSPHCRHGAGACWRGRLDLSNALANSPRSLSVVKSPGARTTASTSAGSFSLSPPLRMKSAMKAMPRRVASPGGTPRAIRSLVFMTVRLGRGQNLPDGWRRKRLLPHAKDAKAAQGERPTCLFPVCCAPFALCFPRAQCEQTLRNIAGFVHRLLIHCHAVRVFGPKASKTAWHGRCIPESIRARCCERTTVKTTNPASHI